MKFLLNNMILSHLKVFNKTFLVTIFFIGAALSVIEAQSSAENIFSVESRLKFGNHLFDEKDYLRAMNEFREYLKQNNNDTIRFKYAESLFRIKRYSEAADNFKGLFFSSPLADEARLSFFKAHFFLEDYKSFRELTFNENYFSEKYAAHVNRLRLVSHFFDNSILPDTNIFFSAFDDSNKSEIKKIYLMKRFPEYKSPTKAALLSAAIPGLGKIYTGEIGDGITSFIATGVLTFLAVNNFKHDHTFRGWLFTGLAFGAYAGNIYGSAASAQIFNAGIRYNFDKDVRLYLEKRNYFLPKIDF